MSATELVKELRDCLTTIRQFQRHRDDPAKGTTATEDRIARALPKMLDRIAQLEAERNAAVAKLAECEESHFQHTQEACLHYETLAKIRGEKLAALVEGVEKHTHHLECEDGFYSCPRAENYFGAAEHIPREDRQCECSAEPILAAIRVAREGQPT